MPFLEGFPTWTSSQLLNRWADYIELSCLDNLDHLVSIADIIDKYLEEHPEEVERGSSGHSQKYDNLIVGIKEYFNLLLYRASTLNEYYPFEIIDKTCIVLKPTITDKHYFYIFLLVCSNSSLFDGTTAYNLTHAFEDICCKLLRLISPDMSKTEIFGTSRNEESGTIYKGNLKARIALLAEELSALTSKAFDKDTKYNVSAGDGGLDLVSYLPFDGAPFIPFAFAQCACSYEKWYEKQNSISPESWSSRLNCLAPYLRIMFIPFYYRCASGEFENLTQIASCLIDRHRIMILTRRYEDIINDYISHPIYETVQSLL